MTEDELSKVADLVFQKLETKFHALDGVVGARGRRGEDGKLGPQGLPGRDASDGKEGKQGISTRLIVVYKLTADEKAPTSPNGGLWDFMTNTVTPPDGWEINAPNDEIGYLWQSQAIFSSDGKLLQAWTQPFRLNVKDGGAGEDALNIEYVYYRTASLTDIPSVPDNDPDADDYTGDWTDNPQGITESLKVEWVCSRVRLEDGRWGPWIGPTIWSIWGSAGKDGDGVQYVYKVTDTNKAPDPIKGTADNKNINEFIPEDEGWTDDPTGVSQEHPFEWVSKRKFNGETKEWGEWSEPKLWASWGQKGDTGLSAKFMYQDCLKGVNAPVVENRKDNPGALWKELVPFPIAENHVIWACLALIDGDGHVWIDESLPEKQQGWQGPWIITGADGEKGLTGNEPDYVVIVFKKSTLKPAKPNSDDPKEPGDGWSTTAPLETNNDNWWGCWGNVTHVDNPEYVGDEVEEDIPVQLKTITWGDPLPLNGNMGNPCVIASFQVTNISSSRASGIITDTNGSINQGVNQVSYTMHNPKLTVTVLQKTGYTVKVTSANCNIGTTKWFTCKETNNNRQRSAGAMHVAHVLIDNNNTIYCLSLAQENKNNDSSAPYNWGDAQTSFTMTIFGTVTRNSMAGQV